MISVIQVFLLAERHFAPVSAGVPEPGSVALLVGMTTTCGVFATRKRRARK